MDKLFVATSQGNIPIEQSMTEKYKLEKGLRTPFSGNVIVDKNSNAKRPPRKKRAIQSDDKGIIFTTSEILDFSSGADSGS